MNACATALLLAAAIGNIACGPAVSDHDNRIFATPASLKLSAADLSAAYQSNAGSANSQYRGRVLEVSGVIKEVHPGGGMVRLTGAEPGPLVEASLHEDVVNDLLKTFAIGQRVTIKCFCEGQDQVVLLKSCAAADPR